MQEETLNVLEKFNLIVNGPALFNAVVSGLDFNLFAVMKNNAGATFTDLCEQVDMPADKLEVLLFALCSTDLIRFENNKYVNSSVASDLLTTDGQDSWKHILKGWQKIYYPAFQHMTQALQEGRNVALDDLPGTGDTLYERLGSSPELEDTLHRSMAAFTLQSLSGLIEHADMHGAQHLLDIGGGDGTTAAALTARYPALNAAVFDVPTVATRAAMRDVSRRVRGIAGNFFTDDFPSGFDTVLFSHVLEIFSKTQILTLLLKAYDALPSGGKVMIYGFVSSADKRSGVFGARLALYLNILASGSGMAFQSAEYAALLEEAGFREIRVQNNLCYEHALITGYRC
ncbi:hypothetical protein NOM73_06505 [Erwinia persicina]|uniref:methyltransferase n=1 Tax=Erwinia persicina TaxID=55211 RepID=UPI00210CA61C|nr:methyltransferase [Erwinia persicina]MCQ4094964.1 hypothetical protein [Erwinia persicina]MCQ4100071.1 hypothetical protein [Erwinia persicina]